VIESNDTWQNLSGETAQVLICDLQEEIVARSKTTSPAALSQSAQVLCQIARLFGIPITLSVVPENDQHPKLIPQLDIFRLPDNEFVRATANPFVEARTREHLASLRRSTVILAGVTTEVVVLHAALYALGHDYGVIVAADACGGMSDRTESAALTQISERGGVISSTVSISTALSPDFTTPQGRRMFEIVQTLRLG
jgi:isochorismate hydrolase